MNDIVLNGETLDIGQRFDTIVIEGFDHLFDRNKMESNLVINAGGGNIKPSLTTFTTNGIYNPETVGYDGFGMVRVDVHANTTLLEVTENGIYYPESGYDGFHQVNVEIPNPITSINKVWQGFMSEYQNLTPEDDALYIIKRNYNAESGESSSRQMIEDICVGSTSFFKHDAYWDYVVENYEVPISGKSWYTMYFLDTGFEIENPDNYDREFEIEFIFYPDTNLSYTDDRVICGCGAGAQVFKELYCDRYGHLHLSTGSTDSQIYADDISGRTIVVKRENRNGTLYYTFRFFEETEPFHERQISSSTDYKTLGIGKYREGSYVSAGLLEFFAFKWLT